MRDVFLWVCFHTEVIVADFTKCNAQCSLLLVTLKKSSGKVHCQKKMWRRRDEIISVEFSTYQFRDMLFASILAAADKFYLCFSLHTI